MFFEHSITAMEERIEAACTALEINPEPGQHPEDRTIHGRLGYMRWLIRQFHSFATHGKGAGERARRANRWIGWMYGEMQSLSQHADVPLNWSCEDTRAFTRRDVNLKRDRPHLNRER